MTINAPLRDLHTLGFFPGQIGNNTVQLNVAGTWRAWSFTPDHNTTLNTVRQLFNVASGTLAQGDITMDLWSSTGTGASALPNAPIETGKIPTVAITAFGFYSFTGFSTALTAGTVYFIVLKNINASPSTNHTSMRVTTGGGGPLVFYQPSGFGANLTNMNGWISVITSNSGSTWTASVFPYAGRVGYSDGTFDGSGFAGGAVASTTDTVNNTNEAGVVFTALSAMKIVGMSLLVSAPIGTPTGNLRLGLWTGSTPTNLGYTPGSAWSASVVTAFQANLPLPGLPIWISGFLPSPTIQTITPGTIVRVTLGETAQTDTASNAFVQYEVPWDSDANSMAMLPFGTLTKTYFNGTTWTDNALATTGLANVPQVMLLLQNEETSTSSGGTRGYVG